MKKLSIPVIVVCLICIGCPFTVVDYMIKYDVEIQNRSGVAVFVDVGLHGNPHDINGTKRRSVAAEGNETIQISFMTGYREKHPNRFVRPFYYIKFYNPDTKELIAEYHYHLQDIDDIYNDALKDEELLYTVLEKDSDGAWQEVPGAPLEKLFVPSDIRPFYLERDKDNASLAYLIITDVPTP